MKRQILLLTALSCAAVAAYAAPAKKPVLKKKPTPKATAKPAPKPVAPAPETSTEPQSITLGNLTAEIPPAWTPQPPTKQFRLLEFAIPKAGADTAASLFIVFHFGKNGGGKA